MMNLPFIQLTSCVTDSGHDEYNQPANDLADGDDGEWPNDADNAVEVALQFCFVVFGNPGGQRRHPRRVGAAPRCFGNRRSSDHHVARVRNREHGMTIGEHHGLAQVTLRERCHQRRR
jgi:hypothetical protein